MQKRSTGLYVSCRKTRARADIVKESTRAITYTAARCALLVLVARAGCNYRWAVRLLSSFVVADWWRRGAALLLLLPLLLLPLLLLLVMVMVVGVVLLLPVLVVHHGDADCDFHQQQKQSAGSQL